MSAQQKNKFSKLILLLLVIFSLPLFFTGCTRVNTEAVEEEAVEFAADTLPAELLANLADKEAIMVGEFGKLEQHQEFLATLVIGLHQEQNLNQVVLNHNQAYGWIFDKYVQGDLGAGIFVDNVISPWVVFLERIREYNLNQPQDNRVNVTSGDINFHQDQFINSLQFFRRHMPESDSLNRHVNNIISAGDREKILESVYEDISENKEIYAENWGSRETELLLAMLKAELDSIPIRDLWDTDYIKAHKEREDFLKELTRTKLDEEGRVLFNYGFYHLQKNHKMGTEKEWLGEYLSKEDTPYDSYNLVVVPLRGSLRINNNISDEIDLLSDPPSQELISTTAEIFNSDNLIYLNLQAEGFQRGQARINLHHQTIEAVPNDIYDGLILLPEGSPLN